MFTSTTLQTKDFIVHRAQTQIVIINKYELCVYDALVNANTIYIIQKIRNETRARKKIPFKTIKRKRFDFICV